MFDARESRRLDFADIGAQGGLNTGGSGFVKTGMDDDLLGHAFYCADNFWNLADLDSFAEIVPANLGVNGD